MRKYGTVSKDGDARVAWTRLAVPLLILAAVSSLLFAPAAGAARSSLATVQIWNPTNCPDGSNAVLVDAHWYDMSVSEIGGTLTDSTSGDVLTLTRFAPYTNRTYRNGDGYWAFCNRPVGDQYTATVNFYSSRGKILSTVTASG